MKRDCGFTLVELLIVVAIIGLLAAISLPGLVRARIAANHSGAIGDLRAMVAGQFTYRVANAGSFGHLTCLATPSGCGFESNTTRFITPDLYTLQLKSGYGRSFAAGAVGSGSPDPGLVSFLYVATPVSVWTGDRGFAVDGTGAICFTDDRTVPPNNGGAGLAAGCQQLR